MPKLNREELETACEDFSNIVQTNDQIIIYKGTLSNSTQIVVVSTTIPSIKEWTQRSQIVFRRMVSNYLFTIIIYIFLQIIYAYLSIYIYIFFGMMNC